MARTATKAVKSRRKSRKAGTASTTPQLLLRAASAEFTQRGFAGTDTNRIARRAGFAPQTFYRWYIDKTDIFIQVYRQWITEELKAVGTLEAVDAPVTQLVDICVAHHRTHLKFRRDLR